MIHKQRKIYIASSWKNQYAVELLTKELRTTGYEVISWIENNFQENHNHVTKAMPFEDWVNSHESRQSFLFDTNGVRSCQVMIYLGPAGKDAAAEVGMAFALGKPILGLWAKGEDFGLMRKMITWCDSLKELTHKLDKYYRPYYWETTETATNDLTPSEQAIVEPLANMGIQYS